MFNVIKAASEQAMQPNQDHLNESAWFSKLD